MNNPPAFPSFVDDGETVKYMLGMSVRDYFAARAMQAILPTYNNIFDDETGGNDDPTFPELLAKDAYIMADAMLKAREA
jgi:hypothetical protein